MNIQRKIKELQIKQLEKIIGQTSATITSGTATTRFDVVQWAGPNLPIGSKIYIQPLGSPTRYNLTTTANITTGSRNIDVSSFTPGMDIRPGSTILYNGHETNDRMYKQYNCTHVHMYHTGSTHGNDMLPNFSQFNFNINAGSALSDGDSKPNRWGSQFAFFVAPDYNCKIERIISHASSNGGTNEDWKLRYWKKPVNEDGTANTLMTLIDEQTYTSQNNQNYVFTRRYEPTTAYALDKGDTIIITMAKTGSSKVSSTKFYADIEIITSFYIK
jgi:hypothetical protein